MPRFLYWTILIGTQPTAFRARNRDDLVPTLKQLQRRHPEATLLWFERGRLWGSPQEARAALEAERRARSAQPRSPGWRPGGEHRDPRERFRKPRDQRKREILRRLRQKEARGDAGPPVTGTGPATPPGRTPNRPARRPPRDRQGTSDSGSGPAQVQGARRRDGRTPRRASGRRRQ